MFLLVLLILLLVVIGAFGLAAIIAISMSQVAADIVRSSVKRGDETSRFTHHIAFAIKPDPSDYAPP